MGYFLGEFSLGDGKFRLIWSTGYYEHLVISNVKKAIPQSVKTFWNEWRASMKKAETDITGDQKISEGVEMAGWGVEEAQEKDNAEASMFFYLSRFSRALMIYRRGDKNGTRICNPQGVHLRPYPSLPSNNT